MQGEKALSTNMKAHIIGFTKDFKSNTLKKVKGTINKELEETRE